MGLENEDEMFPFLALGLFSGINSAELAGSSLVTACITKPLKLSSLPSLPSSDCGHVDLTEPP